MWKLPGASRRLGFVGPWLPSHGPRAFARVWWFPLAGFVSLVGLFLASAAHAQNVELPIGASLDTANGAVDLACGSLSIGGAATGNWRGIGDVQVSASDVEGGSIEFSGNWQSPGGANVGGLVRWADGCGISSGTLSGSASFEALEVLTSSARIARFSVSGERTVTSSLRLQGQPGSELILRSDSPGTRANLTLANAATQLVSHVDVADMDASGGSVLAPGAPSGYASIDSGNNSNWFQNLLQLPSVPIPTLGWLSAAFLIFLLALFGLTSPRLRHNHMA